MLLFRPQAADSAFAPLTLPVLFSAVCGCHMASTSANPSGSGARSRLESPSCPASWVTEATGPAIRHPRFYYDSGDCVLQLQHTLFRISRSILVRDSPVFCDMFGSRHTGLTGEGLSDDLPIHLPGDKADDFRSLCKYLHAPVLETQADAIPLSQLHDILAVGNLAHKYQMASWQQWVLLVIRRIVAKHPGALFSADLVAIYGCKASDDDLRNVAARIWMDKIRCGRAPVEDAIRAAEAQGTRGFLVQLYTRMLAMLPTNTPTVFRPTNLGLNGVASVHRQRILAAHWSLSTCWAHFREQRPQVPVSLPECQLSVTTHNSKCVATFTADWENAVASAEARFELHRIRQRVEKVLAKLGDVRGRRVNGADEAVCLADLSPLQMLLTSPTVSLEDHFFVSDDAEMPPA
ncbi:hypothetical protein C8R43DRAFT_1111094 [Mycena crocata]|nr:hypothetical protein C8R43DRAFT_1111094 [Mycena crocata]